MPKRFDCEEEPNDFMEMPCMCDCGNWFDLTDSHKSLNGNKVICRECHEGEEEEATKLNFGDRVWFIMDCMINGRKVAEYNDSGRITSLKGILDGKVSVKIDGKKRVTHHVPVEMLEKSNY